MKASLVWALRGPSAVEDVLLAPTPFDALLELLVELFVELDRIRVDARPHDLQGLLEVGHRDLFRMFGLAECDHGGFAAQSLDVGARIAIELHRELFEVHAFEGHALCVYLENREPGVLVRRRDEQDSVESPGSE